MLRRLAPHDKQKITKKKNSKLVRSIVVGGELLLYYSVSVSQCDTINVCLRVVVAREIP